MTNEEFASFTSRLFTAFPCMWDWLQSNSPDPLGTQAIWRDTLRPYTANECLLVLESWVSGRRPAPKAYERSHVALMVKQSIEFDRDKQRQAAFASQSRESVLERRRAYQPTAMASPGLRDAYLHGRELIAKRDRGEITAEEFDREKQLLIDSV